MALEVTTGDAVNVAPTSATLEGTVDDFGPVEDYLDVWFKYSTDYDSDNDELIDPLTSTVETINDTTQTTPVDISHDIDSLQADTTYYYRIVAEGA